MYPKPDEITDARQALKSVTASAILNPGLVCGNCRRPIDTLRPDQPCSECGKSVALSLQEKNHERFNEIWLKNTRHAFIALIIATAIAFLMDFSTLVNAFGVLGLDWVKPLILPMHIAWFAMIIVMLVTTGYAFWNLSWPDAFKRYPGLTVHGRWLFLAFLATVPVTFAWQVYISQGQSKIWDKISTASKLIIITSDLAMSAVWLCLIFLAAQAAHTCMQERIKNRLWLLMAASIITSVLLAICFQLLARYTTKDLIDPLRANVGQIQSWINLVIYVGLIASYNTLIDTTKKIENTQQVGA